MPRLRIHYNCPTVLTFSLLAVALQMLNALAPGLSPNLFAVGGSFSFSDPFDYFRLFSHVLGHGSFTHLLSNLTFILLLGPMLEEKHGSDSILVMILITAFVTAVLNIALFDTGLLGASGIVFMLIILSSIVDIRRNSIPLSFILVSLIFLGNEVVRIRESNTISEMAHIVGGVAGAVFGFISQKGSKS